MRYFKRDLNDIQKVLKVIQIQVRASLVEAFYSPVNEEIPSIHQLYPDGYHPDLNSIINHVFKVDQALTASATNRSRKHSVHPNKFLTKHTHTMKVVYGCIMLILISILVSCDTKEKAATTNWKLDFDTEKELFSVSHEKLGVVLEDARLYAKIENEHTILSGWTLREDGDNLMLRTSEPLEVDFDIVYTEDDIKVRASVDHCYISALAPAPKNRFPARVADPDNMQGQKTGENDDYTGVAQIEKYFVPANNPQVMYLSLGDIDASHFYSLFDKASNTVIQFSQEADLKRSSEDQLEILMPIDITGGFIHLMHNYYTDVLGMPQYKPFDDTYHMTAPTGWNHWLAFFRKVTEKDIVDHADFIAENLKAYGMEHCQLDDGFDHPDRRLWSQNWDPETFPHGPEWLAQYIKSKGLIAGLWTVPYCYSINDANPDWFLRDDEGNILMDYQGGGELDFSKQEVIDEYWIPLWKEFKRQGWEYYKFDMGNTSRMWYNYEHNFSDTSKSSYDVSQETLRIFREIMGPEIWHTNHPDIYGGRMGYIDVAGCGRDPAPGWEEMNNFLEVISNNTFQNHIVWYSDPDCIVLRGKPTRADDGYYFDESHIVNDEFLTLEEARTCASLLSLSGMQFLSGDDLLNLEEDRLDIIKKTIPMLPIFPNDLFGRSRFPKHYPEIMDLKINASSGVYDVITVTNWQGEEISRKVLIDKELGLDPDDTYLVFDSWKEQFIGGFQKEFLTDLPVHGTQVFIIRKLKEHPQLLATNRHITGAVSITANSWDDSDGTLSGASESIPGAKYVIYYHVPEDFSLDDVSAEVEDLSYNLDETGLLTVSFMGQENPSNWTLKFSNDKR